jgi:hypothetical protein
MTCCDDDEPLCIWIGGAWDTFVLGYSHPPVPVLTDDGGINYSAGPPVYINDAVITYVLNDPTGTPVPGGTGSFAYLAGSSGNYQATILDAVTSILVENVLYQFVITMRQAGVVLDVVYEKRRARKRGR